MIWPSWKIGRSFFVYCVFYFKIQQASEDLNGRFKAGFEVTSLVIQKYERAVVVLTF